MFVDISQFQPENINWQVYRLWSVQTDGVSRVALRSSYGIGFKDELLDQHRQAALNAGIDKILYYHYCYPQFNDPVDEANSQKNIVGAIRTQDELFMDYEENVVQATSSWAYQWLLQQQFNYGKIPGIYASDAYILQRLQDSRLSTFDLWLANWQFDPNERPTCPTPWKSYKYLQYTDKAFIPGIPEGVDADISFDNARIPIGGGPTMPTQFQIQAAKDCWNSTNTSSPIGTGIYMDWLERLSNGQQMGPPLTKEYNTIDWSGKEIVVQEFAHARVEWNGSSANWYNENGLA